MKTSNDAKDLKMFSKFNDIKHCTFMLYVCLHKMFAKDIYCNLRNFYVKVLTRKYGAIKCTNMFVTDHTE